MRTQLEKIKSEVKEALNKVKSLEEVNELKVKYLGKKGELTQVLRGMGQLVPEERPIIGQLANEIRDELNKVLDEQVKKIKKIEQEQKLNLETIDVTLPGKQFLKGTKHPLSLVIEEAKQIFMGLGFQIAEGPEIETDYYNFEALNLPKDHPARDMQDTFYITSDVVLRTHTSPVQVRSMESLTPEVPVKIICPGKVYRKDDDATHSPMFHQIEGLVIDMGIRMSDLKGVLLAFVQQMFGPDRKIRFRPSYFPFTEPSAEVDVSCGICKGDGCKACSYTGWLEILGSGMVHPNVLKYGGYDPTKVKGFAFGMGVERIAMLKYNINDMRLFFENDIRFLRQF
ncbi:MAG: phenylalanyl-tRNA synthetase alpha chain [Clostridia bacterium]|nr:phenylalanyl-tRNA synthetase alpha chain [Clostridia bacterium]MDN5322689.1 phenylalanyl-tRNA synthetase alpha chain [Clostridia bacterium]